MLVEKNMYAHEVKLVSDQETIEKAKAKYEEDMEKWHKEIDQIDPGMVGKWYDAQVDESTWKKVDLPSSIETTEIGQFDGMVWYRRTVDIPSDWGGKEMSVSLGAVDDQDVTYFNGTKIGGLNDNKQSRNYKIDGSLVRAGKNTIVVKVQDYGQKDRVCCDPIYQGMKVEGRKIRLSFEHTGSGLVAKESALANFVIAGADKKFVPAKATIEDKTVVVSSDTAPAPVAVRYAFDNAGVPSLFNKEGLPASSFRTDEW